MSKMTRSEKKLEKLKKKELKKLQKSKKVVLEKSPEATTVDVKKEKKLPTQPKIKSF